MSSEDDMLCGLTVDERDKLKSSLAALPDTMPPRSVWRRIEAQATAEGLLRHRFSFVGARWLAGGGIAAAVVLVVLGLPRDAIQPATIAESSVPATVPDHRAESSQPAGADLELRTIDALVTRSRVLERDLRRLPSSPALTRASTAATIDRLERQIAVIDHRLNDPRIRLTRRQQELYWRERVRLMNSLLQLRYAQLQRGAF